MHGTAYGTFGSAPSYGAWGSAALIDTSRLTPSRDVLTVRADGVGSAYVGRLSPKEVFRAAPPFPSERPHDYEKRLYHWIFKAITRQGRGAPDPNAVHRLAKATAALLRRRQNLQQHTQSGVPEGYAEVEIGPEAQTADMAVESGGNVADEGGVAPHDADWRSKITGSGPQLGAVLILGGVVVGGYFLIRALSK